MSTMDRTFDTPHDVPEPRSASPVTAEQLAPTLEAALRARFSPEFARAVAERRWWPKGRGI